MALRGVHHIALISNDMKAQIEFFTQVVGMKLTAIFPMHGVPGAAHCFLEAGKDCYLSFVQVKGVNVQPVYGVSHARDGHDVVAGGAMQHLAFNVDTYEELMNLRDRLRSKGYAVLGPMDHNFSHSMYLGAPEGILLEFATSDRCEQATAEKWVVPDVARELGMGVADLQRYVNPPAFAGQHGAVPQPSLETAVYPTPIPRPMWDQLGYLSDTDFHAALSYQAPIDELNAAS